VLFGLRQAQAAAGRDIEVRLTAPTVFYKGRQVDRQVHLGFDLASIAATLAASSR